MLGIRRDIGDLALARALLAMGQLTAAARLLNQLLAQAHAGGQWGDMIDICALQALALQAQVSSQLRCRPASRRWRWAKGLAGSGSSSTLAWKWRRC